jgi:hypothetical protein
MHAIMVRIAYGERDGARLKKRYLENVLGRWACQPVLECMRESGEIQRRGQYMPGSQCFLYLPAEHYRHQKLRDYVPTNPDLLRRLANARQEEDADRRRNWQPIHTVWERWQRHLRVDREQAREIIAAIPIDSNPYDVQSLIVDRIHRREHRYKVDDFGRVHNDLTNMCRVLRPALRVRGQQLSHLDIVNSQPALLAVLIGPRGNGSGERAGSGEVGLANSGEGETSSEAGSVSIYDRRGFSPVEGVGHYRALATAGRLYEHLMATTGMPRGAVKKGLLRDVFGKRGSYPCPLEDAFRASFPAVHQFIRWFNRDDHAALLRHLQRVESDLVIDRVGRRLHELRCTGCISLHDAVYCARSDIEIVEQAFRDAVTSMQMQIKLKVER